MEVLITAGGTEEPIDGVRAISNFSTGKTGAVIADIFHKEGFKVTLLTSLKGISPVEKVEIIRYQTFNDLNRELKDLLSDREYSGVIHSAAVSDYSVDFIESEGIRFKPLTETKLDSSKPLRITLKPNFKIIDRIKDYSSAPIILIGFKLTKNASQKDIDKKVSNLFSSEMVDFVVQNDLISIHKNSHISAIYAKGNLYKSCKTKVEMGIALVKIFKEIT